MILHIGGDAVIRGEELIAVLSTDREQSPLPGKCDFVRRVGAEEPVKSALLVEKNGSSGVWLSPISAQTLKKRAALQENEVL